jgi:hypothetical protein
MKTCFKSDSNYNLRIFKKRYSLIWCRFDASKFLNLLINLIIAKLMTLSVNKF